MPFRRCAGSQAEGSEAHVRGIPLTGNSDIPHGKCICRQHAQALASAPVLCPFKATRSCCRILQRSRRLGMLFRSRFPHSNDTSPVLFNPTHLLTSLPALSQRPAHHSLSAQRTGAFQIPFFTQQSCLLNHTVCILAHPSLLTASMQ